MDEERTARRVSAQYADLAGKVAIVSGASRGIGVGIAEFLGRQEMRLILTARSQEADEAVAAGLSRAGAKCAWVTANLATADGARQVFDEAVRRYGAVDVLVNNAALRESKPFLKLDEDAYHATFERSGSIIHISSVGGLRAHRGLAGYDASKGAIDTLTRSMALDLGPYGIRVNAVAPGQTRSQALYKLDGVPLGRAAKFPCTDENPEWTVARLPDGTSWRP